MGMLSLEAYALHFLVAVSMQDAAAVRAPGQIMAQDTLAAAISMPAPG